MLVAACASSTSPSVNSAATTAGPSVPQTSATTAGPSASAPSGVAGTWSGYGPCPDLEVKLGPSEHDPAVTYQVIEFTNRGPVSCILSGYPGVSLAAGTPAVPVGLPAGHTGFKVPAKLLMLRPGAAANATLEIPDVHRYPQGNCGPVQAQHLIVYRPNETSPVSLAFTAMACSKSIQLLQVSAVSLGTGG